MLIELTGSSTRNKGAELMMVTVRRHFGVPHSAATLAVTPWFGDFQERAKYNLATKLDWKKWNRERVTMSLVPRSFRRSMGIFDDQDLNALVDVSGFAFGDQHPARRTIVFGHRVEALSKLGKKVILLPQAFGPFERPALRAGFGKIVEHSHLIYARDPVSLEHIEKHFGKRDNVKLAPDITIGFDAGVVDPPMSDVLIVPNIRMLDRSDPREADAYIPLLQACIRSAQAASQPVKVLLHDADEDKKLVPDIQKGLEDPVEVIADPDPVSLKQRIASSKLLIGSRFHAIVAALSSGVPALSTGWSHKYEMLLNDFGCPDAILKLDSPEDVLGAKVSEFLQPTTQSSVRTDLARVKVSLRTKCDAMWTEVDTVLGWSPTT